jgi:predicted TIM-barrel fold metal-dependent hydrolase
MAAEIASAANDWLAENWLQADERFRGSIVVGPRDGEAAAAEIRRLAGDQRWAQIVIAFPPALLGDRAVYPILEAAAEAGLPVCLQAGGAFVGANPGPTPTGFPTTAPEYLLDSAFLGVAHLASLLLEGVCERLPSLRVVLSGFGIGWLPSLLWRLEGAAGVLAEHVRFTTRDLDAPSPQALLEVVPADEVGRLLLYASGSGGARELEPWEELPPELSAAVLRRNAASWLRVA